jgi:hypothetical protein
MPVLPCSRVPVGRVPVAVTHNQRLWAELHTRAARDAYFVPSDSPVPEIENQWLTQFAKRIRCKKCRAHWLRLVRDNPPPFADSSHESRITRASYFAWTVKLHNLINARIGKPILSLRVAKKLWHFDSTR